MRRYLPFSYGDMFCGVQMGIGDLIVIAPVKGKLIHQGDKTFIDNVVVDVHNNAAPETSTCELPDWALSLFDK